jgi:hypothetical protein
MSHTIVVFACSAFLAFSRGSSSIGTLAQVSGAPDSSQCTGIAAQIRRTVFHFNPFAQNAQKLMASWFDPPLAALRKPIHRGGRVGSRHRICAWRARQLWSGRVACVPKCLSPADRDAFGATVASLWFHITLL